MTEKKSGRKATKRRSSGASSPTVVEVEYDKEPDDGDSEDVDADDGDSDDGDSDDIDADDVDADSESELGDEADFDPDIVEVEAEAVEEETFPVDSNDTKPLAARTGAPLARTNVQLERGHVQDPLAAYMREVQRHPLLTREEEHQLAVNYAETGDVVAAKKLVTSNLRLVVKIAYEYKRAHKNMMDLVQEGNIGLMQAVKRYDPHRGVKLSSYSAWWIRAYILRYILNNWRLVKLGTTQAQRKLFFNLNKERARLAAMGIEPTHEEIAKRLDVASKEVQDMDLRLSSNDASLDMPIGDSEGRQTSRLELMPSALEGPERLAERSQLIDMLRDHLATFRETLKGKELEIFDKRMIAEERLTLQELGDEFGVSRERVRQLEARITAKLRKFLYECLGDAVDDSQDPAEAH